MSGPLLKAILRPWPIASGSKAENLERMEPLVARAAATGADLVLLPEKWNGIGTHEIILDVAEPLDSGESVGAMSAWAKQHGMSEGEGHYAGVDAIRPIVEHAADRGLEALSIYAFSRENCIADAAEFG